MTQDHRHDILFEPVKIGPVTARNRFYQVPHCNGMGHRRPRALAAMRGIKAEGGWAVVSTEECEIHPSTDVEPFCAGRLWDEDDIPYHALTCEAIHAHGALAAVELVHQGPVTPNRMTRIPPMGPSARATRDAYQTQARTMDKADIRALRRWYVDAATRAQRAGYDIVYLYAGHGLSVLQHFLVPRYNRRGDEYGGSLENRVRLLREVLEETKAAIGGRSAVALRLAVDELMGPDGLTATGEGHDVVAMLAELPDLWDVNVSDWPNDSQTARFAPEEGYQEAHIGFVKALTSKPVVGVGRYTSPDAMVSAIRRGVMDLIGAARPSIADPFLPKKVGEGRIEDIRECIGCNICVTGDNQSVPIRCTQNPTMGEEWRRGWHPERIAPRISCDPILVVGAGPAGLECAMQLGLRGYPVTLAEAGPELGGRLLGESRLPGLASYIRVRDHRALYLRSAPEVAIYRESALSAAHVHEFGAAHVYLGTGAHWRADGVGPSRHRPIPGLNHLPVYTPDDLMAGAALAGDVLIFDDDNYLMGGVLAEKLIADGCRVTLVTNRPTVSCWTADTMEQPWVQARLMRSGVELVLSHDLLRLEEGGAVAACAFTGRERPIAAEALVLVTERVSENALYAELSAAPSDRLAAAGIRSLTLIGDAHCPATVAAAVHSGHLAARRHEAEGPDAALFRREGSGLAGCGGPAL